MIRLLFRNRWIAVVWAMSVLGSIAMFVSEGGGSTQVEVAARQIREQRAGPSPDAMMHDETAGFTPDEELFIDEDAAAAAQQQSEPRVSLVKPGQDAHAADHGADAVPE